MTVLAIKCKKCGEKEPIGESLTVIDKSTSGVGRKFMHFYDCALELERFIDLHCGLHNEDLTLFELEVL